MREKGYIGRNLGTYKREADIRGEIGAETMSNLTINNFVNINKN